jgi:hypothetical protein
MNFWSRFSNFSVDSNQTGKRVNLTLPSQAIQDSSPSSTFSDLAIPSTFPPFRRAHSPMSPPLRSFSSSSIPDQVPKGLKVSQCPLKQIVQFECILDQNDTPICFPVTRMFRAYYLCFVAHFRCSVGDGEMLIEVTKKKRGRLNLDR